MLLVESSLTTSLASAISASCLVSFSECLPEPEPEGGESPVIACVESGAARPIPLNKMTASNIALKRLIMFILKLYTRILIYIIKLMPILQA